MDYADSSVFVSAYLRDAHSARAYTLLTAAPDIFLTPLNRAEFANALSQYVFRGFMATPDAQQAWAHFESDRISGRWCEVAFSERIWNRTIDLARRHGPTLGIRTLDSLHVASAIELGARRFWTFDDRQARLAQAAGLDTNP